MRIIKFIRHLPKNNLFKKTKKIDKIVLKVEEIGHF